MEVPPNLLGTFNMLNTLGHSLRQEHGEEFRRHVRFDDVQHDLYLEVKFSANESWQKISKNLALEMRENETTKSDDKLREKLSLRPGPSSEVSGPSLRHPRLGRPRKNL
jgi:hypothetical protein